MTDKRDDFSWAKSIGTLVFAVALLVGTLCYMIFATPAEAVSRKPDNGPIYYCKELYYSGVNETSTDNMMAFAACIDEIRNDMRRQKEENLWEFLKKNPRYRFAGQSWNKCFNRPKERALARYETKPDGSTMAYYKDKIAECY